MIEQRIADRFRSAVLDEPPLGFNPDDVVDRAKRRQRHRRAVMATALATGGVAVAAVAVFAASTTHQIGTAGPGVATTSETKPSPSFPAGVPQPKILDEVGALLDERVPGFRHTPGISRLLSEKPHPRGFAYELAEIKDLRIPATNIYMVVDVRHEHDQLDLAGDPAAAGGRWGSPVSDTVQLDGSHLRVYRNDESEGGGLAVVHLRTDGVIVEVDVPSVAEAERQGLAVTEEVLIAVATDPRLTL